MNYCVNIEILNRTVRLNRSADLNCEWKLAVSFAGDMSPHISEKKLLTEIDLLFYRNKETNSYSCHIYAPSSKETDGIRHQRIHAPG